MRRHITAAHQETAPVLEEAAELMTQKDHVETKQELLRAFNAHFIMSEDDVATLTSTAEPVNDRFFVVLSRAKRIEVDCEVLLGTENQRLGLEIMDQITKNLNGAFQKLHRWIQREFKSLNLENPQISSSIRRALRVLAERPSLFQNCLDFFAEAREHVLTDTFYTALTGSSVSGEEDHSVKPIELAAHDPLRYVGDMLAWTHSATVSEREALEVLFISDGNEIAKGIQAGRDHEPWNREADDQTTAFDGLKALNELVDRDVAGVAKILRQRVEQVIASHEETIMAYKIANLLNFYRVTFSKLLDKDSVLLNALSALEDSAMRQFRALMRDHITSLQVDTQLGPDDLDAPDFLQEALKQLTAIMKTYDTSLTPASTRESSFRPILVEAFDPYMSAAKTLATSLEPPSNSIYAVNCLLAVKSAFGPYDFVSSRVDEIQKAIDSQADILTAYQYSYLLHHSGLASLLGALAPLSPDKEEDLRGISELPVCKPEALAEASQTLDDFLPSALMDAMENLKGLADAGLAREVTEEAAEKFCEDFELIEERLVGADELLEEKDDEDEDEVEEGEQSGRLRAVFQRTSADIRVLLS